MEAVWVIVILLIVIGLWCVIMKNTTVGEPFTTGFAVTSGLAANNRTVRCWGPNGALAGGCTIPHRVII